MKKSKLRKIIREEIQTQLVERKYGNFLKWIKVTEFPEKWTVLDIVNRYDREIFEYLWNEHGLRKTKKG